MAVEAVKTERNQSIEVCRLAAAILVIFIHDPLPEPVGGVINCLGRFAVPFFFMVSGYFSLHRDSRWAKTRLAYILRLDVYASLLYYLWEYILYWPGTSLWDYLRWAVFQQNALMEWLLRHVNPAAGHLWYLAAMVPCYLGLWLYSRFREGEPEDNRPLYLTGFLLMCGCFVLSTLLPASGVAIPYQAYRNGWLMGVPLFLLGRFLHEFGEKLTEKFSLTTRRLLLIMAVGITLSLLQWRAYGITEVFLGTIPELMALLLLLLRHPILSSRFLGRLAPRLGRVSTIVYVIHLLLLEAYELWLQGWLSGRIGLWEPWLKPFLIAAAALGIGFLWDWLLAHGKKGQKLPS